MKTATKRRSEDLTDSAVLRPEQAAHYLGITKRHLYNIAERDATFPRKIVFGPRCVGWRRVAIEQWLLAKEAANDG